MTLPTKDDAKLQGFVEDEKVPVSVRYWESVRRLCAKLMLSLRQIERESSELLRTVQHDADCPALTDAAAPCKPTCPDHETYLSARVIAANCSQHVGNLKLTLPKTPDGFYLPPPREFIDRIVGELEFLRAELDARPPAPEEVKP